MKESFRLTLRALVRGHVLTLLLAAVALVHALFPAIVRADSTEAGWREMFIRAVPGFVVGVVLVVALSCACGFFSREREKNRLALTVVRPASAFAIAVGRWLALCLVAVLALGLNAVLTFARLSDAPDCQHHVSPILPPPVVTDQMIDEYLDEEYAPYHATTDDEKKAIRQDKDLRRKATILLMSREKDRYDVVEPKKQMSWMFPVGGSCSGLTARASFSAGNPTSRSTYGELTFGTMSAVVSNDTKAVVDIPLAGALVGASETNLLVFANLGKSPVLLRPRSDIELLRPADSFLANLVRSTVQSFAVIALLAAFGIFLSATLSRPVAIFSALVLLVVALMVPDTLDQFPDSLDISLGNRIGLALSRVVASMTAAFMAPSPVADLATGRCIEWGDLARTLLEDVLFWPTVFLGLSALVVRRRPT